MKKLILLTMLAFLGFINQHAKAQITLEHTYDSASSYGYSYNSQLYIINLEVEGQKYIKVNRVSNIIELYNLDHSIFKVMNMPLFVNEAPWQNQVLYVTEHLFNNDNLIEYMLCYTDTINFLVYHTKILNELGNIIFSVDSAIPGVVTNYPQIQLPIYNTTMGTKMILSFMSDTLNYSYANVYSLPGVLTNMAPPINYSTGNELAMENIYPNPSNGNTTIKFHLPQGENNGEIIIYNMQGTELKRYRVDNTFHNLLINNSELHSGTYFYQLITANGATGAKKMIVIK